MQQLLLFGRSLTLSECDRMEVSRRHGYAQHPTALVNVEIWQVPREVVTDFNINGFALRRIAMKHSIRIIVLLLVPVSSLHAAHQTRLSIS